jgi:hypothetical protein
MKNLFLILLFSIFSGCSVKSKIIDKNCNENLIFKNLFFNHIETIEGFTYGKDNKGNFRESLKFISQYVPVSYDNIANYTFMYDSESFKIDKENWLKWYEKNKCNNIQFK